MRPPVAQTLAAARRDPRNKQPPQVRLKRGNLFSKADRAWILETFVFRYTGEHMPLAFSYETQYRGLPRFRTDAQWLTRNYFFTTYGGRVDRRLRTCLEDKPGKRATPQFVEWHSKQRHGARGQVAMGY